MDQENITRIDINLADESELTQLKGVGARLAQRIVDSRPFESIDDLVQVKGLSEQDVERLRPFVTIDTSPVPETDGEEAPEPAEAPDDKEEPQDTPEAEIPSGDQPEDDPEAKVEIEPDPEVESAGLLSRSIETVELPPESLDTDLQDAPDQQDEDEETEPAEEDEADDVIDVITSDEDVVAEEVVLDQGVEIDERMDAGDDLAPSTSREKFATIGQAIGITLIACFFTIVLTLAICMGFLSAMNGGSLQFASPGQVSFLAAQMDVTADQVDLLSEDLDGLRTRMDNLEALSGRVSGIETDLIEAEAEIASNAAELETLSTDVEAVSSTLEGITVQMEDMSSQIDGLNAQSIRFEGFLEGLRNLMVNLFPDVKE